MNRLRGVGVVMLFHRIMREPSGRQRSRALCRVFRLAKAATEWAGLHGQEFLYPRTLLPLHTGLASRVFKIVLKNYAHSSCEAAVIDVHARFVVQSKRTEIEISGAYRNHFVVNDHQGRPGLVAVVRAKCQNCRAVGNYLPSLTRAARSPLQDGESGSYIVPWANYA